MNIKINYLDIENFKGIQKQHINFSDKTVVSGRNASGKTSIVDAFTWLLFDKDSSWASKFNVRPLDKDGNRIDNIEIKVIAELDVDGKKVELSKIQKQNWVKQRGTGVVSLQGNVNDFEVNSIPMKQKDYNERIADMFDDELFKLLTNPTAFVSMKWQEQRKALTNMVSDVTDFDVANSTSDFKDIIDDLRDFTVEELTAKAKKALSQYKKEQMELPIRIDELKKSIPDIDVTELNKKKKEILASVEEVNNKIKSNKAITDEFNKKSDGIIELHFKKTTFEREEYQKIENKRKKLNNDLISTNNYLNDAESECIQVKHSLENTNRELSGYESERKYLVEEYKNVSAMEFDEKSIVCAFCGQVYPADKQIELKNEFENKKSAELDKIVERGNSRKELIKSHKDKILSLEKKLEELEKEIIKFREKKDSIVADIDNLPSDIDLNGNEEYTKIVEEIKRMEQSMKVFNNGKEFREELNTNLEELNEQLMEVEKELSIADTSDIDKRIKELTTEQKEVGQLASDQENILFMLEKFTRMKMEMLSGRINGLFKLANWKLFDMQLNGGITECCECTVNGVPYSDLNSGHKIAVGLDIITALQRINNVTCPVFIDNAESINDTNMPAMECQTIELNVSEDEKLTIK